MESAWTNLMSVGNKSIDAEHKLLLNMVHDIEGAIVKRDSAGLLKAFKLFEDAVGSHFRNEAGIAKAINFPFEEHILEHQYVLNELKAMRDELVSNAGRWSESAVEHYYGFLSKWATLHIDEDDMRMKAILDTLPYDFKPPESPT
jgi:hemerythrin